MSEKNDLNGSEGGEADDLETSASDELPPTESPADGEDDFGDDAAAVTSLLGPERWVQFGFIAIGFAAFFVADKFLTSLCETDFGRNLVGAPDPMIVTTSAGIIGLVSAFAAYRHPVARKLADEVVAEMRAEQELRGQIARNPHLLTGIGPGRVRPAVLEAVADRQGQRDIVVVRGRHRWQATEGVSQVVGHGLRQGAGIEPGPLCSMIRCCVPLCGRASLLV